MLYIFTALHWEAVPFIEHYHLELRTSSSPFAVYTGDEVQLTVTGQGKLKMAAAVAARLARGHDQLNRSIAVNIGTCGSAKADDAGKLYSAKRVIDNGSSSAHMLPAGSGTITGRTLETFDMPVTSSEMLSSRKHLADMEASGFVEAACCFFAPDKVVVLKVVSDMLQASTLSRESVYALFSPHVSAIADYLNRFEHNCTC